MFKLHCLLFGCKNNPASNFSNFLRPITMLYHNNNLVDKVMGHLCLLGSNIQLDNNINLK